MEASAARPFTSSEDFVQYAIEQCLVHYPDIRSLTLTLKRSKALLQPACSEIVVSSDRGPSACIQSYRVENLECFPIVGVNDCERLQTQLVRFDLSLLPHERNLNAALPLPIRLIVEKITAVSMNCTSYLRLYLKGIQRKSHKRGF